MGIIGNLLVSITASTEGLQKGLKESEGMLGGFEKSLAGLVNAAPAAALAAIGGAAVGAAMAAGKMALEFQDATNAIITGTGASGEALTDMQNVTRNLMGTTAGLNTTYGTLGAVVAEANTRLGITGSTLETFAGQVMNYSRLTGTDAVTATQLITRVMGDWSVPIEKSSGLMDMLFGASQAFGVNVDSLATKVVQFGAPLRQMGFSLNETIAMFGKWEKEGVNAELVIGSLRQAAGNFARENIPLRQGLLDTMRAIKGASSESEALNIAMKIFGAEAGPDMAAAIREGRFELDSAVLALQNTSGGLADATDRSLTMGDQFTTLTNNILTQVQPTFENFFAKLKEVSGPALLVINDGITRIYNAFGGEGSASLMDFLNALLAATGEGVINGIMALSIWFDATARSIEIAVGWAKQFYALISNPAGNPTGSTAGSGFSLGAAPGIPGHANGGMVAGQIGEAQLAMVHGGEMVLTPAQQQQRINNFNLTVNSTRGSASLTQEFATLQALAA